MTGALVLVSTPIGNLGDLSPRAVDVLRTADVIACEDTRRTRALLTHAGLSGAGRLRAVPAHAEAAQVEWVLDAVTAGATVAFTTDAGMPAISDPGSRLVRACLDAGLAVDLVPGPTAVTAALVLSGLPTDRFVFEGFLPRKGRARADRLREIATEARTVVVFESPRRVGATLADLAGACGRDRPVALARELTKLHQEVRRGTLGDLSDAIDELRGECVLVIGGVDRTPVAVTPAEIDAALREAKASGASTRDAAGLVSERLGVPRREVYARAVELNPR